MRSLKSNKYIETTNVTNVNKFNEKLETNNNIEKFNIKNNSKIKELDSEFKNRFNNKVIIETLTKKEIELFENIFNNYDIDSDSI